MKRLIIVLLIGSPIAITTMERPVQIENPAVQSENAYAQALFNGDLAEVKSFLQGGAHADYFVAFPGATGLSQRVGYELPTREGARKGPAIFYAKMKPIEFLWSGDASQEKKLAIAEVLIENGADADKTFLNSLLAGAVNDGNLKLVQWLIKHGARDEAVLEDAKAQLDASIPEEKEDREKIYKILTLIKKLNK